MAAAALVGLVLSVTGGTAAAAASVPATSSVELPPAEATVVVDAGTGAVLEASNDRTPVGVASAIKLFTALVVDGSVKPTDLVRISKRAASMPYLKLSAKAGQHWRADGLLHAMLLASANDAAVAMAEQAGRGTKGGYERLFTSEAAALHLQDSPTLQDPAGLDDEFSVGGGNLISARDLAIVARAFLRQPDLASIVQLPDYRFPGGDGRQHRVVNHDRFIRSYPGAIGLKTGYTSRSGYTLVAAARRNGHTLIAVVVRSANTVQEASNLLDAGFAALRRGSRALAYLPASGQRVSPSPARNDPATRSADGQKAAGPAAAAQVTTSSGGQSNPGWSFTGVFEAVLFLLAMLGVAVVLRRRQVVRRRELARRRRAQARHHVAGATPVSDGQVRHTTSARSRPSARTRGGGARPARR